MILKKLKILNNHVNRTFFSTLFYAFRFAAMLHKSTLQKTADFMGIMSMAKKLLFVQSNWTIKGNTMSELHTNLYIKHAEPEVNEKLGSIFKTINDKPKPDYSKIEELIKSEAITINPEKGDELASRLLEEVKSDYGTPTEDLVAESRGQIEGYYRLHFVHGGSGTDYMKSIIEFLGNLSPDVDVRACLVGDDDPWEIFYKFEQGEVIEHYYEPDYDEAQEGELPELYTWWHEGLPSTIKDGFINEWLEEECEEE